MVLPSHSPGIRFPVCSLLGCVQLRHNLLPPRLRPQCGLVEVEARPVHAAHQLKKKEHKRHQNRSGDCYHTPSLSSLTPLSPMFLFFSFPLPPFFSTHLFLFFPTSLLLQSSFSPSPACIEPLQSFSDPEPTSNWPAHLILFWPAQPAPECTLHVSDS